ncbi:hypothetical protein DdX_10036 [Ditylenchus destructor]|uniref:Uncharacterized protein n=1 Tax=Ditylenchus destructor TaxID=166010 RepID=A0AAD4MZD5_9BILA|nr:hypothetical protein DdX_10036 [Ditylenchus destructor]
MQIASSMQHLHFKFAKWMTLFAILCLWPAQGVEKIDNADQQSVHGAETKDNVGQQTSQRHQADNNATIAQEAKEDTYQFKITVKDEDDDVALKDWRYEAYGERFKNIECSPSGHYSRQCTLTLKGESPQSKNPCFLRSNPLSFQVGIQKDHLINDQFHVLYFGVEYKVYGAFLSSIATFHQITFQFKVHHSIHKDKDVDGLLKFKQQKNGTEFTIKGVKAVDPIKKEDPIAMIDHEASGKEAIT